MAVPPKCVVHVVPKHVDFIFVGGTQKEMLGRMTAPVIVQFHCVERDITKVNGG